MCFPSVLLGDFEKSVDFVQLLAVSISVPHTLHIHTHTCQPYGCLLKFTNAQDTEVPTVFNYKK